MDYYNNYHSSSRNYYRNLQKNTQKNLNSSKTKLNTLDCRLEKFLNLSYKYLSPLFEDEETIKSYKKDTNNSYIDKKFDQEISKHSPPLIISMITFFTNIYKKYFTKDYTHKTI